MDYAKDHVKTLSAEQRRRYRKMLNQNINVGAGLAKIYGIDPAEFMQALKEVLD